MEPFSLEWAAQCMGGQIIGQANGAITSVCVDSRQAKPGALFFALQGEHSDGHQYVTQALRAGAIAAVVEHPISELSEGEKQGAQVVVPAPLRALGDLARHYRRQFAIPIVGVTGSVGKTSTKEMIAQVLRTTYNTLANEKNYNNEIGVPLTLFNLNKTHQAAVVEMGMRGLGQIDYLAQIAEPTIGVITNIGTAHIELLGSQENIARAKAELFARLPANGVAILSQWDTHRQAIVSQIPAGCRTMTFTTMSIGPGTDVRAKHQNIQVHADGTVSFRVRVGGMTRSLPVKLQAVGTHHVPNALAALAVAYALNVPTEYAIAALEAWQGAEGRMSVKHGTDNITILDDCYNASPESMRGALETLEKMSPNGVAVLGDMKELGEYAEQAHTALGKNIIAGHVRLLVTVGALAKRIGEDAQDIVKAVPQEDRQFVHFADAQEAAVRINEWVRPGDTVLVKGSRAMGMEIIVDALLRGANGETDANATVDNHAHA